MGNYPDGAYDADPRAPWNQPDPWDGEECGTCRYCGMVGSICICVAGCCLDGDPDGYATVRPREAACESYRRWDECR